MMETNFALTELDRRVSNLIQIAAIVEADYFHAKVKVKMGDIITHWLPWLTVRAHDNKTWWAPEVGEQVLLLAPSGELAQAVVLPAIYSAHHVPAHQDVDIHEVTYKDGSILRYDRKAHILTGNVNADGRIELIIGASRITMTDDAIRLSNGGSELVVTNTGISAQGGRIDLN